MGQSDILQQAWTDGERIIDVVEVNACRQLGCRVVEEHSLSVLGEKDGVVYRILIRMGVRRVELRLVNRWGIRPEMGRGGEEVLSESEREVLVIVNLFRRASVKKAEGLAAPLLAHLTKQPMRDWLHELARPRACELTPKIRGVEGHRHQPHFVPPSRILLPNLVQPLQLTPSSNVDFSAKDGPNESVDIARDV